MDKRDLLAIMAAIIYAIRTYDGKRIRPDYAGAVDEAHRLLDAVNTSLREAPLPAASD
jgi:hypothetical protein